MIMCAAISKDLLHTRCELKMGEKFCTLHLESGVDRGLDRCEFTGWRVSNGQPATTTSNVKFNNKNCTPLAL